jgi:hypothetical protein
VPFDGLDSVGRARRIVTTGGGQHRTDEPAIQPQRSEYQPLHRRARLSSSAVAIADRQRSRSALSCRKSAYAAAGLARTTSRWPGTASIRSRTASRSRRLTRLRVAAFPIDLLTTNPTWTGSERDDAGQPCSTTVALEARRPRRTTRWKSAERRSRWMRGSTRAQPASGCETVAALAPATGEDRPTGARTHAQTEAVRLGAATVVGLERALTHGRTPRFGLRTTFGQRVMW